MKCLFCRFTKWWGDRELRKNVKQLFGDYDASIEEHSRRLDAYYMKQARDLRNYNLPEKQLRGVSVGPSMYDCVMDAESRK